MPIKIAVIGKRGHAGRYISILKGHPEALLQAVYYPFDAPGEAGLPLTKDFSALESCDAVIIASPTHTHFEYLERLKAFKGYILLDKPAVNRPEEQKALRGWDTSKKSRVRVNFNLIHSPVFQSLSQAASDETLLGQPLLLDIQTSHGLAFKPSYRDSWRANKGLSAGVLETVGVHYIHIALKLFGPIEESRAQADRIANNEGPADTTALHLKMAKGTRVRLWHSYAAPCINRWFLIGTNGIWEYDGLHTRLRSPRETFDAQGRFISPPITKQDQREHSAAMTESLKTSLEDFIAYVKNARPLNPKEFDLALAAMDPVLD